MKRRLLVVAVWLFAGVAQAGAPGTVEPPKGPALLDGATGDAWARVTEKEPATFVLTGPGKFQVGFRVNLPKNAVQGTAGIVSVRHGSKPLAQFRLQPKAGADTWKDRADVKPAQGVGFFVEVGEGPQTYEFRLNGGGELGGAVRVIEASQSKRPLPATAPVVKAPAASATAVAAVAPTPAPAATPKPGPVVAGALPGLQLSLALGPALRSETSEKTNTMFDTALGLRWNPLPSVFVDLGSELRRGKQRVALTDAPDSQVRESRESFDLAAGYRMRTAGLEILVGPAARLTRQRDAYASHHYATAGLLAQVAKPIGSRLDLSAGLEGGIPVVDDTPDSLQTGWVLGRGAWNLGASARILRSRDLRVGADYRGELVSRYSADRLSHGALVRVSMGL